MKDFVIVILIIFFAATIFPGCGGNSTADNSDGSEDSSTINKPALNISVPARVIKSDSCSINIEGANLEKIAFIQFKIEFDTGYLQLSSIPQLAPSVKDYILVFNDNYMAGTMNIAGTSELAFGSPEEELTGDSLTLITFNINPDSAGITEITLSDIILNDRYDSEIELENSTRQIVIRDK